MQWLHIIKSITVKLPPDLTHHISFPSYTTILWPNYTDRELYNGKKIFFYQGAFTFKCKWDICMLPRYNNDEKPEQWDKVMWTGRILLLVAQRREGEVFLTLRVTVSWRGRHCSRNAESIPRRWKTEMFASFLYRSWQVEIVKSPGISRAS